MDLVEIKAFNFNRKSRHPWEIARLHFITHLLTSNIRKIEKSHPVIFDIGCGDAFAAFTIAIQFPGTEVHAVDTALDDKKILEIQKLTGTSNLFLYNSMERISMPAGKSADFVLLLDVIEHIGEDAGFLADLFKNRLISKDSYFIITAPAFPALFSSHDIMLKHYRRYTRRSLMKILQLSGFQSLESGYFFFVLLIPRILRLYLEKLKLVKSSVDGIGQWKGGRLKSAFFLFFLQADHFIGRMLLSLGITLPGLSVYCVCKPVVS
jgi:hypothetical protein